MRIQLGRLAAACIPLTLLAVSACGPQESDTKSGAGNTSAAPSKDASPDDAGQGDAEQGDTGAQEQKPGGGEPTEVSTDLPDDEAEPEGWEADSRTTKVLRYDVLDDATEYAEPIQAGVDVWNQSLGNVQLVPVTAGQQADIQVTVGNGWPETYPIGTTSGMVTITMGRKAFNEGHSVDRVAAHEFGHALGLDDRRSEGCSSLMSGHKGGVDCQNTQPDAFEQRAADAKFAK